MDTRPEYRPDESARCHRLPADDLRHHDRPHRVDDRWWLALVVTLLLAWSLQVAIGVAAVAALGMFVALAAMTIRFYFRVQASLQVAFPTPLDAPARRPTRVREQPRSWTLTSCCVMDVR